MALSGICRHWFQLQRTASIGLSSHVLGLSTADVFSMKPLLRTISTSPCLYAEPLKKKKRLDPAIVKAREDRKKRKLEKAIRRLEKHARQLKPLEELEVPVAIVDHYKQRERKGIKISPEEEESRWLLQKEWTRHMFKVNSEEIRMIDRMLSSQHKALEELKQESEELYQAAIQLDFSYVPCQLKGPVETPPIKDFVADEGDFNDISRKWD